MSSIADHTWLSQSKARIDVSNWRDMEFKMIVSKQYMFCHDQPRTGKTQILYTRIKPVNYRSIAVRIFQN